MRASPGEEPPKNNYAALKPAVESQDSRGIANVNPDEEEDFAWQAGDANDAEYDVHRHEEIVEIDNSPMPEDMYGFALTSLFRDTRMIALNRGEPCLRRSRLLSSQVFILLCIFTQGFLLVQTKLLVTSMHVHEIRDLYDRYELHMYGGKESHTTLTVNGNHRGKPEFFEPQRFHTLDDDIKNNICTISLSRPWFFMVILLIWTLTCLGEVKGCCNLAWCVFSTPTISTMRHSMCGQPKYAGEGAWRLREKLPEHMKERVDSLSHNDRLVIGLTGAVKAYVLVFILFPRLVIAVFLNWLGCRWLLATSGFENVLLNAVALEFILVLKNLLYDTVLPERNRKEVQCTNMIPPGGVVKEKASCSRFFGSFAMFLLAIVWVYLYTTKFQQVIPGYMWDVRDVCHKHVEKITS